MEKKFLSKNIKVTINEESSPNGLKTYEKVHKEDGTINKDALKAFNDANPVNTATTTPNTDFFKDYLMRFINAFFTPKFKEDENYFKLVQIITYF